MNEKWKAYKAAGYREKYAVDHGKIIMRKDGNQELMVFKYSKDDEYQDANGAAWSITKQRWVG